MLILIMGSANSGKSKIAEDYVCRISKAENRIYLATMIPYGEEGANRVLKHKKQRDGLSFVTIEKTHDVCDIISLIDNPKEKTVLLECIPNLVANEIFEPVDKASFDKLGIKNFCDYITGKIVKDVMELSKNVKNLVVVTYSEFEKSDEFDDETIYYINTIKRISNILSDEADDTIKV